eukprot:TRINITY_DN26614_c0_g1_i2.p2 TRINITY_DN26614_c0_g1~~TRINITY_DN26614_c0_g1_i2.p2  ORF type:complete len:196 (+),score=48.75 TRINITY_DN26614_c0_g1_i2:570-1157(+)
MRMLNPCGSVDSTPTRSLEPAEEEIKAVMVSTAPQKVLQILTQLMRDMFEKAKAPCTIPEEGGAPEEESGVTPEIKAQVKQTMEQMRVDSLPQKYKTCDWTTPKVCLSVCRLTDAEAGAIASALEGNDTVTSLDLSHNELGDLGIQQLLTCMAMGGAKNLTELRINSNKYGPMGRNMLAGLATMRKGLKLSYDKE